MHTPNPWILLIGGGALFNVALMIGGIRAPLWVRYGGMALCIALGLTAIGMALVRGFQKQPVRAKYQPKRRADVELSPETVAKLKGNSPRGGEGEPPKPPNA